MFHSLHAFVHHHADKAGIGGGIVGAGAAANMGSLTLFVVSAIIGGMSALAACSRELRAWLDRSAAKRAGQP